jgi:hypothetical protein
MSQISVTTKLSRKGEKTWYYLEWGKAADQRRAAGLFTYINPKSQIEKNHNKETIALLEVKKSQLIIEFQSIGTTYIPNHKFKHSFLDYYQGYVDAIKGRAIVTWKDLSRVFHLLGSCFLLLGSCRYI